MRKPPVDSPRTRTLADALAATFAVALMGSAVLLPAARMLPAAARLPATLACAQVDTAGDCNVARQ